MPTPTDGNLAVQPEWRREVSSKLQAYRARRRAAGGPDLQTALQFEPVTLSRAPSATDEDEFALSAPAAPSASSRKRRTERFEISIPLQESAPGSVYSRNPPLAQPAGSTELAPGLSVASLAARFRAGLMDGIVLLFSFGGMFALFTVLGGRIGFNKLDLAVTAATLVLFYAQYFALFTMFGGLTPGMMLLGLRVVTYEGDIPTSRQMVWRSFGYLISAGTCFLGFLWALWDEDHLTWQDRISQTYLTANHEITAVESLYAGKTLGGFGQPAENSRAPR